MNKLKIFFDRNLINSEFISFLSPILGMPKNHIWGENKEQIKDWSIKGKDFLLEVQNIKDADIVIYPKYFILDFYDELKKYSDFAKNNNKKVLVFCASDIEDFVDISNNITWYKRSTNIKNNNKENCLSPFPEDLIKYNNGKINFIDENKAKFNIGYTGYSNYYNLKSFLFYNLLIIAGFIFRFKLIKKFLLIFKNEKLYHLLSTLGEGKYIRGKVIKYFKKTNNFNFDCIVRKHGLYINTVGKLRKEYIDNIIKNDFLLVARGNGNYSFRLYEVISLGKIPIYIDTNAKLPFEDEINYDKLFIKIPLNDIKI